HVEQAVTGHRSFSIQARALGCFPHRSRPRLLWMGLHDSEGTLAHLQQCIESALQPAGFVPEQRPFHPHLTLARTVQAQRKEPLVSVLRMYSERFFGDFPVTHVQVFQSHLHRQGAVYTVLQTIPLFGSHYD
ncbi:MAG TPA: RNA 2',3'-cyclic phosphodiesterase, partial [Candidatus Tectomicrobia bacterium]